jgi:hypothetical protein
MFLLHFPGNSHRHGLCNGGFSGMTQAQEYLLHSDFDGKVPRRAVKANQRLPGSSRYHFNITHAAPLPETLSEGLDYSLFCGEAGREVLSRPAETSRIFQFR